MAIPVEYSKVDALVNEGALLLTIPEGNIASVPAIVVRLFPKSIPVVRAIRILLPIVNVPEDVEVTVFDPDTFMLHDVADELIIFLAPPVTSIFPPLPVK